MATIATTKLIMLLKLRFSAALNLESLMKTFPSDCKTRRPAAGTGDLDGAVDGLTVGALDGLTVGDLEGAVDGDLVGRVGALDGVRDGALEGAGTVGAAGTTTSPHTPKATVVAVPGAAQLALL
jgi:hypothetical protein